MLKDHYGILGLPPSATLTEIKKAYRRLALELHPDRTHGDPYAKERFYAIKEAYEVLTNPGKRSRYLQERWYEQSMGRKTTVRVFSPDLVLRQAIELDRYVRTLDVHRMDKVGLFSYCMEILGNDSIARLNEFKELPVNDEIVRLMLRNAALLSTRNENLLLEKLKMITTTPAVRKGLTDYEQQRARDRRWESLRPWLVVLVSIILTLLIFFAAG